MNDSLRTWAEIDIDALKHNYRLAKKLSKNRPVMPVIKGDAHGHGAVRVGRLFQEEGAAAFAVACISEAVTLRKNGITVPILILGWTAPLEAGILAENDITQSVFSLEYGKELSKMAQELNVNLKVHVKIDSGMTRTGIYAQKDASAAAGEVMEIAGLPCMDVTGIFTHYAVADMPEKEDFTRWQFENFCAVLDSLKKRGFDMSHVTVHASNSAVIMYHPESYFDMVRLGVMMYGLYPANVYEEGGPLIPAMTLKSKVVQVKDIDEGAKISYGCTFTAEHPMTIAVVAAGYADSYPRALSGKGAYAVINGERCPQVGRICMDMCMVDVTGKDVHEGDEVILYGKGGMSHEDVAQLSGSINCEHTSLLTERVKKVYITSEED